MIVVFGGIVLLLTLLLSVRPQATFKAIMTGFILAYAPFQQRLFDISGLNISALDIVLVSLSLYLGLTLIIKPWDSAAMKQTSYRVVLVFFIWGLLAILRGIPEYGPSAIGEARFSVLLILFYFFIIRVYTDQSSLKDLVKWITVLTCLMAISHACIFYVWGPVEFLVGDLGDETLFLRASFHFLGAAEAMLLACIAIILYALVFGQGIQRRVGLLALIFGFVFLLLVMLQIRSVWLALAAGLVLLPLIDRKIHLSRLLGGVYFLVLGLLLIASLSSVGRLPLNLTTSLADSAEFLADPEADATGSLRLYIWQETIKDVSRNPLFGASLGGYFENTDANGSVINIPLHNGYLGILAKQGLIGLLLYLLGLVFWFFETVRLARLEKDRQYQLLLRAFATCIAMFLVYAFFFDLSADFWIFLGIGTALVRVRTPNQNVGYHVTKTIASTSRAATRKRDSRCTSCARRSGSRMGKAYRVTSGERFAAAQAPLFAELDTAQ